MDLAYGPEYDTFRQEVRSFLGEHWPLKGEDAELDFNQQCIRFRKRAIEAGYLARSTPKAYGGSEQEADPLRGQVIREEFGRAKAPGDPGGIGTMMLAPTLLEKGSDWQKRTATS